MTNARLVNLVVGALAVGGLFYCMLPTPKSPRQNRLFGKVDALKQLYFELGALSARRHTNATQARRVFDDDYLNAAIKDGRSDDEIKRAEAAFVDGWLSGRCKA